MINSLSRHFLPLTIIAGFASYGAGNQSGVFNIPSISASYEQMENQAALKNALFPNQHSSAIPTINLRSFL